MSIQSHHLTEPERKRVADALYHEGLGYLAARDYVANVPNRIGSPGESVRVYDVISAVLDGTYVETLLTTAEAARRLGAAALTVRGMCRDGRIPGAYKVGRDWLIPPGALAGITIRRRGGKRPGAGRPPKPKP